MADLIAELIAWAIIISVTFILSAGALMGAVSFFTWAFG